jgi:hypothetical protein
MAFRTCAASSIGSLRSLGHANAWLLSLFLVVVLNFAIFYPTSILDFHRLRERLVIFPGIIVAVLGKPDHVWKRQRNDLIAVRASKSTRIDSHCYRRKVAFCVIIPDAIDLARTFLVISGPYALFSWAVFSSASFRLTAAVMNPMWVKACGKLPRSSPVSGSTSSEKRPRWLA